MKGQETMVERGRKQPGETGRTEENATRSACEENE